MPLQCNIDGKGKVLRLIYGVVFLIVGIVLIFVWAIPSGSWLAWIVTVVTLASGVLAIFEARAGWCIMRAMGFRTPL
jgi:hypothetical protein